MSTRYPNSFIYLASPYSDADQAVVTERVHKTELVVAAYLNQGHVVFSPILHCHELAINRNLPTDAAFWWKFNRTMLVQASELWLLTLDGWDKSKGMRKESLLAIHNMIPLKHVHYAEALVNA